MGAAASVTRRAAEQESAAAGRGAAHRPERAGMLQEQKPARAGIWDGQKPADAGVLDGEVFDRDRKAARETSLGQKPDAVPQVLTIHR